MKKDRYYELVERFAVMKHQNDKSLHPRQISPNLFKLLQKIGELRGVPFWKLYWEIKRKKGFSGLSDEIDESIYDHKANNY